jgi:hypothetical protein
MPGVNTVTAAIARAGHPEVELVRGEGYHYYVFDQIGEHHPTGEDIHESHSVPIMHFGDRSHAKWVESGIEFAKRVKAGTYDPINTHDL